MREQSSGPTFGRRHRQISLGQQTDHRMRQLFFGLAKNQIAKTLLDRGDGCFDLLLAICGSRPVCNDSQRNRGLADGYTNRGLPASPDYIGKHGFQIAFTHAETFDRSHLNHSPLVAQRFDDRW
jgi:hypothetical protein